MKKEYKKKKGETLGKWVERLSQDVLWQRLEGKMLIYEHFERNSKE